MSSQSGIFSNSQAHPVAHATFDKGYIHNDPLADGGEGLIDKNPYYYEYNPVLSKPNSGINIYKYGTPMENNYPTDRRGPSFTPTGNNPFEDTGYPPTQTTEPPFTTRSPVSTTASPASTTAAPATTSPPVTTTAAPATTTAAPATTTAAPVTTTAAPDDGGGGGGGY